MIRVRPRLGGGTCTKRLPEPLLWERRAGELNLYINKREVSQNMKTKNRTTATASATIPITISHARHPPEAEDE